MPTDNDIRQQVYRFFVDHQRSPTRHEVAEELGLPVGDVAEVRAIFAGLGLTAPFWEFDRE